MNKVDSMSLAAKLVEALSRLPDDADVFGFETLLDTDSKPWRKVLSIHLTSAIKTAPFVVDGKQYSGWREKRVWMAKDVYVWWAENDGEESA